MKDNFSNSSDKYAKFRPTYPQTIFEFLYPLLREKNRAWDCGTGNGQIALELSKEFDRVEATDISRSQLNHAFQEKNIQYSQQPAEKTNFESNSFDLITVGQAVHWFDIELFNQEVKRVGKQNSIIALIGYELAYVTPEIDEVILHFYKKIIGPYWDAERKHLEQRYESIPFPFKELETPAITNIKLWKLEHLIGYLNTWSSVKHFIKAQGYNPIDEISKDLKLAWGTTEIRKVNFPIIFRVGRIK